MHWIELHTWAEQEKFGGKRLWINMSKVVSIQNNPINDGRNYTTITFDTGEQAYVSETAEIIMKSVLPK